MKTRFIAALALPVLLASSAPAEGPILQVRRAFTGVTPTTGTVPVVLEVRGFSQPAAAVACRFLWPALPATDVSSADLTAAGSFAAEDGIINDFSPDLGTQPQNVTEGRTRSYNASSLANSYVVDDVLRFTFQAPGGNATIKVVRDLVNNPFLINESGTAVSGVTARGINILPGLDPQAEVVNRLLGKAVVTSPELLDASFDTDGEGDPAPVLDAADVALTAAVL